MERNFLFVIITLIIFNLIRCTSPVSAQNNNDTKSFILLGDIHYDLWQDHDSIWLAQHPDDYRQVTQEYTMFTKENNVPLINEILTQSKKSESNVIGIIQTGDLQEGLAGNYELAVQMSQHAVRSLRTEEFTQPWILVKGNHDVTGPGAEEAYRDILFPFISGEVNTPVTTSSYSYMADSIKIISLDCYDRENIIPFLQKELNDPGAKVKIIATHQPVIPVSGRLWHIFESEADAGKRIELLNLIAINKAIVVTGHLHKYAVVERTTEYGSVVQVMINSVINDRNINQPQKYTNKYGSELVDLEPNFNPGTKENRKQYLAEEARYIIRFSMGEMPGYGIIRFEDNGKIFLNVYAGLGQKLYETVRLQ